MELLIFVHSGPDTTLHLITNKYSVLKTFIFFYRDQEKYSDSCKKRERVPLLHRHIKSWAVGKRATFLTLTFNQAVESAIWRVQPMNTFTGATDKIHWILVTWFYSSLSIYLTVSPLLSVPFMPPPRPSTHVNSQIWFTLKSGSR